MNLIVQLGKSQFPIKFIFDLKLKFPSRPTLDLNANTSNRDKLGKQCIFDAFLHGLLASNRLCSSTGFASISNKLDALFNVLLELRQALVNQFLLSGRNVPNRMNLGNTLGLHPNP